MTRRWGCAHPHPNSNSYPNPNPNPNPNPIPIPHPDPNPNPNPNRKVRYEEDPKDPSSVLLRWSGDVPERASAERSSGERSSGHVVQLFHGNYAKLEP